jgi:hypothetical protein
VAVDPSAAVRPEEITVVTSQLHSKCRFAAQSV